MHHRVITTAGELDEYVAQLHDAPTIAFDTEFVSEYTYRPVLCLIQVAVGDDLVVIDPIEVGDVTPFWSVISSGDHETIVHAGRQELLFCMHACGSGPKNLFDIQLAAGFMGLEFPASYGNLVQKLLAERPQKAEARTDWRRRPLTDRQIDYALADVAHLQAMRDVLHARLEELDRLHWMHDETQTWQAEVDASRTRERWRKVSGSSGLARRDLAILRELWRWREAEAERRDVPARKVLRDDLLVEVSRRRSDDVKRIRLVRGLEGKGRGIDIGALAASVRRGLDLADSECPTTMKSEPGRKLATLSQFLTAALTAVCRNANMATQLVGTASDVRELIGHRLEPHRAPANETPALLAGWRGEVVGKVLDELIDGTLSIRIENPRDEQPLNFVRNDK